MSKPGLSSLPLFVVIFLNGDSLGIPIDDSAELANLRSAVEEWKASLESPRFHSIRATVVEEVTASKKGRINSELCRDGWTVRKTSRIANEKGTFVEEAILNDAGNQYWITGFESDLSAVGDMRHSFEHAESAFYATTNSLALLFGFVIRDYEETVPDMILHAIDNALVSVRSTAGDGTEFRFRDKFYEIVVTLSQSEPFRISRLAVRYDHLKNPRANKRIKQSMSDSIWVNDRFSKIEWGVDDGGLIWPSSFLNRNETQGAGEIINSQVIVSEMDFVKVGSDEIIPISVPRKGFPIFVADMPVSCQLINGIIVPSIEKVPATADVSFSNAKQWGWGALLLGIVLAGIVAWLILRSD